MTPAWRPLQLAFLLMNLDGLAPGSHADRKVVDLLFFPTGGGQTEAYLGLAAFTMVLRRLRERNIEAGVRLDDRQIAQALRIQFDTLIARGKLCRVPGI